MVTQNREYEVENCTQQISIARINISKHLQTKKLYYEVTLITGTNLCILFLKICFLFILLLLFLIVTTGSAICVGWTTTESSLSNVIEHYLFLIVAWCSDIFYENCSDS